MRPRDEERAILPDVSDSWLVSGRGRDHREVFGRADFNSSGPALRRWIVEQVEPRELVRGRKSALDEVIPHSGTTAVASISTRADGLTSPLTSTSAIAG